MTMINEALRLRALGWSLIPIKASTKQPALKSWKPFQEEIATEQQIRRWCAKPTGMAVVCGPVSQDLFCRDFDTMQAYEQWASLHPQLAESLPTVATARGRHVYCRIPLAELQRLTGRETGIHNMGDGELRAAGYCLIPPSVHPSGKRYQWLIPLNGPPPLMALAETGFFHATESTESTEENRGQPRRTEAMCGGERLAPQGPKPLAPRPFLMCRDNSERNSEEPVSVGTILQGLAAKTSAIHQSLKSVPPEIAQAICSTLPTQHGMRHRLVFEFARALKAIPSITEATAQQMRPFVKAWHGAALPFMSTKPFEETWIDFLRAWPRVRFPKGQEPMAAIFERAKQEPIPDESAGFEQAELKLLVKLCRELQRASGDGPFYLSARTAGKLLGIPHTTAWRWLFLLQTEGLLTVVEKGTQAGKKATRFRYLGKIR